MPRKKKSRIRPWMIWTASIFTGLLSVIFLFLGYVNSVRNEGITKETALSASVESEQNQFTTMVTSLMEMGQIQAYKTDKMEEILSGAVQGRYGDDGFSADGAFFAAVAEAYPDLTQLDGWDDLMTEVSAKREQHRGMQDVRIDRARDYLNYLDMGILKHFIVAMLGFPSDRLIFRKGDEILTGRVAIEAMTVAVKSEETNTTYSTGETRPLDYTGQNR